MVSVRASHTEYDLYVTMVEEIATKEEAFIGFAKQTGSTKSHFAMKPPFERLQLAQTILIMTVTVR